MKKKVFHLLNLLQNTILYFNYTNPGTELPDTENPNENENNLSSMQKPNPRGLEDKKQFIKRTLLVYELDVVDQYTETTASVISSLSHKR